MSSNSNRILVGIPTRDRPEYLACLLSSLLFQTEQDFDIFIVDSSEAEPSCENTIVSRFLDTHKGLGRDVRYLCEAKVVGRSEAASVNQIMYAAYYQGYGHVYKIDDDHVLPPNALTALKNVYRGLEHRTEPVGRVILSGVTPWMAVAWEGASGPATPPVNADGITGNITGIVETDGDIEVRSGHHDQYAQSIIQETQLPSAANFFMRPDISILWSDICESSLYADAVWFLQLRKFLNYQMYFYTGISIWHVAANVGGVRERDSFEKDSFHDGIRKEFLRSFYYLLKDGE